MEFEPTRAKTAPKNHSAGTRQIVRQDFWRIARAFMPVCTFLA
jgi:hypothetical protein